MLEHVHDVDIVVALLLVAMATASPLNCILEKIIFMKIMYKY